MSICVLASLENLGKFRDQKDSVPFMTGNIGAFFLLDMFD